MFFSLAPGRIRLLNSFSIVLSKAMIYHNAFGCLIIRLNYKFQTRELVITKIRCHSPTFYPIKNLLPLFFIYSTIIGDIIGTVYY